MYLQIEKFETEIKNLWLQSEEFYKKVRNNELDQNIVVQQSNYYVQLLVGLHSQQEIIFQQIQNNQMNDKRRLQNEMQILSTLENEILQYTIRMQELTNFQNSKQQNQIDENSLQQEVNALRQKIDNLQKEKILFEDRINIQQKQLQQPPKFELCYKELFRYELVEREIVRPVPIISEQEVDYSAEEMKHVIDYFEEKIYVPYYSKVPETHNEQLQINESNINKTLTQISDSVGLNQTIIQEPPIKTIRIEKKQH